MSISDKLRVIEELVKLPQYAVVGLTHGRLVYTSMDEGIRNLWVLDVESGDRSRITDDGFHGVADVKPNSPLIIYTKDVSGGRELQQVFSANILNGLKRVIVDFEPRRIFGMSFDGERIAFSCAGKDSIEIYVAKPIGEYEKICDVNAFAVVSSIYGNIIAGFGSFEDPKVYEVFIYDLNSGEFKIYTPRKGASCKPPKVYNGRILFSTNAFDGEKLVIYDLEAGQIRGVELPYDDYKNYVFSDYVNYGWTDDGRIWFIGELNGRTRLFIDGREVKLPSGYVEYAYVDGNRVYVTWSSMKQPRRILEVNIENGEHKCILGASIPEFIARRFGDVRFVKYESFDGLRIPMFIFESKAAPKPGPAVVYVHGGPWAEVADRWNMMIASLVASGYHVFAPNFRGSTGYGEEFRRLDIGDPGGGDLIDVVYARDFAAKLDIVDSSKIAIMGYSYGGFMTFLATVKFPDKWRCGVAGAGITDWRELYDLSDAVFKRVINVLFANNRDLWSDRSAINFVENLKVPICILHPQNDSRTPLKPILKYCMKLLELGKTFELHVVPDMGHMIARIEDALKILLPATIFLDKYMK